MRGLVAACALVLVVGCDRTGRDAGTGVQLAIVTDLKGYLEPCGCTSNPLGGIDRLAAQLATLRRSGPPVVFLLAGDTFFDEAKLDPSREDQANRQARTLVGILDRLGVAAVLPGPRDLAQPKAVLKSLQKESDFPWLAMSGPVEALTTRAGQIRLGVVGVRSSASLDDVSAAVQSIRPQSEVVVALLSGDRREAKRVAEVSGIDFVVQGGLDQDDALAPRHLGRAWAFHASRQGQGLTVVDIAPGTRGGFVDRSPWSRGSQRDQLSERIEDLSRRIDTWRGRSDIDPNDLERQESRLRALHAERASLEGAAPETQQSSFVARWIPLPKASPTDREVGEMMRAHDKEVNEANRRRLANVKPPPLGPNDVAYVGSQACGTCHQPAFAWWKKHAHGDAYRTLEERNKEFNLDCVGCHVTGYNQPGGSTVTHNLGGALVNVGCESCHGPGAAHAADPSVLLVRDTPESNCVGCHNEEHSDLFNYDSYKQMLIAPGHGAPLPNR